MRIYLILDTKDTYTERKIVHLYLRIIVSIYQPYQVSLYQNSYLIQWSLAKREQEVTYKNKNFGIIFVAGDQISDLFFGTKNSRPSCFNTTHAYV
jgi:predicted HTH domain antitoxin